MHSFYFFTPSFILLVAFIIVVEFTSKSSVTASSAARSHKRTTTGVFLTNYQLKRLIDGNVLRKADIAKVPCIRRSRRCLVQSIKQRGWKNQKKLNEILNQILNIKDEDKFIDHVLKLMIEDNSDLLKEAKNDGDVSKQTLQHFHKDQEDHSRRRFSRRSELPNEIDFLNTFRNLNDFNEDFEEENNDKNINNFMNAKSIKDRHFAALNDEIFQNFSPEEREYIFSDLSSSYKHSPSAENSKKSQVETPWLNEAPYDEEVAVPDENNEGNVDGRGDDDANSNPDSMDENNAEDEQHSDYVGSDETYNNNDRESTGVGNAPEETSSDSDEKIVSNFIEDRDHRESVDDMNQDNERTNKEESNNYEKEPAENEENLKGKRRSSLKKKTKTISLRNQTYYDGDAVPTPNALAKLKEKAEQHMQSMTDVDITEKKNSKQKRKNKKTEKKLKLKKKKINKHAEEENAKLDSKEDIPIKDQGDLQDPTLEEDNIEDERDFQESLASIQSGWDLDKYVDDDNDGDDNEYNEGENELGNSDEKDSANRKEHHHSTRKGDSKHDNKILHQISTSKMMHNGTSNVFTNSAGYQQNLNPFGGDQMNGNGIPVENMQQASDPYNPRAYYGAGSMPTTPKSSKTNPKNHSEGPTIGIKEIPDPTKKGQIKATRVCKPGVPKPFFHGKPNCLIIGDSIALGYSYSVAAALNETCQVQLSPSSKAGVALDSRYGLQCLSMILSTINLLPTYYDVILFNFGLHDIDYLDKYPEEAHTISDYKDNLRKIKQRLAKTGATVGFILSTPVTFSKEKDKEISKFNHAAKEVMEEDKDNKIYTVNLHKIVTRECGKPPFNNCYMMKKPHDVHYGVTGSIMLGKRVATFIKFLLEKRKAQQQNTGITVPNVFSFGKNFTTCPLPGTRCPTGYTCMRNIVSRSGQACCGLTNGIDCRNSWHCCPQGTKCHPGCKDTMCSCIT